MRAEIYFMVILSIFHCQESMSTTNISDSVFENKNISQSNNLLRVSREMVLYMPLMNKKNKIRIIPEQRTVPSQKRLTQHFNNYYQRPVTNQYSPVYTPQTFGMRKQFFLGANSYNNRNLVRITTTQATTRKPSRRRQIPVKMVFAK